MKYYKTPAKTSQVSAWRKDGYETYKLQVPLLAIRLHESTTRHYGHWFAVDLYNISIDGYHDKLALVNNKGKAIRLKHPDLDYFLLKPGTIFNVGKTARQGFYEGGAWQFEYVSGPRPRFLEHEIEPERIRM